MYLPYIWDVIKIECYINTATGDRANYIRQQNKTLPNHASRRENRRFVIFSSVAQHDSLSVRAWCLPPTTDIGNKFCIFSKERALRWHAQLNIRERCCSHDLKHTNSDLFHLIANLQIQIIANTNYINYNENVYIN